MYPSFRCSADDFSSRVSFRLHRSYKTVFNGSLAYEGSGSIQQGDRSLGVSLTLQAKAGQGFVCSSFGTFCACFWLWVKKAGRETGFSIMDTKSYD